MIVFYIYMAQKCRFSQDQTGRFDIEPHPDEGQEDLLAVAAKVKRYVATLEGGEGGASGGGDNAGDGEEGEEEEEDEDLVRLRRQYRECMEAAVSGAPIPKAEVDKILAAPGPPELRPAPRRFATPLRPPQSQQVGAAAAVAPLRLGLDRMGMAQQPGNGTTTTTLGGAAGGGGRSGEPVVASNAGGANDRPGGAAAAAGGGGGGGGPFSLALDGTTSDAFVEPRGRGRPVSVVAATQWQQRPDTLRHAALRPPDPGQEPGGLTAGGLRLVPPLPLQQGQQGGVGGVGMAGDDVHMPSSRWDAPPQQRQQGMAALAPAPAPATAAAAADDARGIRRDGFAPPLPRLPLPRLLAPQADPLGGGGGGGGGGGQLRHAAPAPLRGGPQTPRGPGVPFPASGAAPAPLSRPFPAAAGPARPTPMTTWTVRPGQTVPTAVQLNESGGDDIIL